MVIVNIEHDVMLQYTDDLPGPKNDLPVPKKICQQTSRFLGGVQPLCGNVAEPAKPIIREHVTCVFDEQVYFFDIV